MNLYPDSDIILRKRRSYGENINVVYQFIAQNKTQLFRIILLLTCPIGLVSGVVASLGGSTLLDVMMLGRTGNMSSVPTLTDPIILISFILSLSGYVAITITCCAFVKLRLQGDDNITIKKMWKQITKYFFPVLGAQFALGVMILVVTFIIAFLVALSASLFSFFALITSIAGIIAWCYFAFHFLLIFPIMIIEDKSFFNAFGRSFSVIQEHWWPTFGVLATQIIIYLKLLLVFYIPQYILLAVAQINGLFDPSLTVQILNILSVVIGVVGAYLVAPVLFLSASFQLFNLVEQKENTGLLQRIDAIGQHHQTSNEEEESW